MIPASKKSIKLPAAIDDNRLSDEVGKVNSQPNNLPSLLEYYVQTIKLNDILGQVLDREEPSTQTLSETTLGSQAILSLDTKIMKWRDRLPTYLKYDPRSSEWTLPGDTTSDATANPEEFLDFPNLSKRLYCRYENVDANSERTLMR